ncbi:MAG: hypothetical protein K6B41_13145 [Butyrivibrio sp.]|nr:hypothetical protein [Butyrivibrio sp.]
MLKDKHIKVLTKIYNLLQNSKEKTCWGLTGSTSFAIQGMDVEPHDMDIQADESTAYLLDELLADYVIQPVKFYGNKTIRSHFGKFIVDGMEVEVMGDIQKKNNGEWEDIIPLVRLLDYVNWNGYQIPVLKLSYEAEAYRKLGRIERAAQLEEFIKNR